MAGWQHNPGQWLLTVRRMEWCCVFSGLPWITRLIFSASSPERTVLCGKKILICHSPTVCYALCCWITPDYIFSTRHPIAVVFKTVFLNPLVDDNQHFFKKWNQIDGISIIYHTKSVYCFKNTFVSDVCVYRWVCVCMHALYACLYIRSWQQCIFIMLCFKKFEKQKPVR